MTAPAETVTIFFTDLVGSTELLQRAGQEPPKECMNLRDQPRLYGIYLFVSDMPGDAPSALRRRLVPVRAESAFPNQPAYIRLPRRHPS